MTWMAEVSVAAPGDQRVIQGTLVWPSVVTPAQGSPEGFIVVRGDDGRTYFADVVAALHARPITIQAGTRVEVVGVEGAKPHVLTAVTVGSGSLPTGFPSALPREVIAPLPSPAPSEGSLPVPAPVPPTRDQAPPESRDRGAPGQTLSGRVQSFSNGTLRLRTSDGRVVAVDMSAVHGAEALHAGDEVTVVGRRDPQRGFVAGGFVQEVPASALPRQR
jgi:hypothetical protein